VVNIECGECGLGEIKANNLPFWNLPRTKVNFYQNQAHRTEPFLLINLEPKYLIIELNDGKIIFKKTNSHIMSKLKCKLLFYCCNIYAPLLCQCVAYFIERTDAVRRPDRYKYNSIILSFLHANIYTAHIM